MNFFKKYFCDNYYICFAIFRKFMHLYGLELQQKHKQPVYEVTKGHQAGNMVSGASEPDKGVMFLGNFAAAYYYFIRKKVKINLHNKKFLILVLMTTGLLLRIIMALSMVGYSSDISLFKS
jgi:hypothetical protein